MDIPHEIWAWMAGYCNQYTNQKMVPSDSHVVRKERNPRLYQWKQSRSGKHTYHEVIINYHCHFSNIFMKLLSISNLRWQWPSALARPFIADHRVLPPFLRSLVAPIGALSVLSRQSFKLTAYTDIYQHYFIHNETKSLGLVKQFTSKCKKLWEATVFNIISFNTLYWKFILSVSNDARSILSMFIWSRLSWIYISYIRTI